VQVIQDGVGTRLSQPALKLGENRVFLSRNIFKPTQGGSLDIGFKADADERVTVRVFNLAGELVRPVAEMEVKAGVLYGLKWDGRNADGEWVASGVYVVSVKGGNTRIIRKVVVLK
jgi:flagellar hook assembly protein FlgD